MLCNTAAFFRRGEFLSIRFYSYDIEDRGAKWQVGRARRKRKEKGNLRISVLLNIGVHKPRVEEYMCGGTSQRPVSTAVDLLKCRFLKGLGETLKMCAGGKPYLPKGPSSISFLYWSLYRTVKVPVFFVEDETFFASCNYQYYLNNTTLNGLSAIGRE